MNIYTTVTIYIHLIYNLIYTSYNILYRVKSEYVHHESLQGAIGVKIVAPDIGRAIAGTPLS